MNNTKKYRSIPKYTVSSILGLLFLLYIEAQAVTAAPSPARATQAERPPVESTKKSTVFLPLVGHNYSTSLTMTTSILPNDPYYEDQWALDKIGAPQGWQETKGENTLIAILDTGADFSHDDLSAKLRYDLDRDFVNETYTAHDNHGHGTHVTGIAAAATDNAEGIVGLGWEAEILPLKVLNDQGRGALSDAAQAIYYATNMGADVINMSFATDPRYHIQCSDVPILVEALAFAYDHGVVIIAAAGNDGQDVHNVVPANCPYLLAVAATKSDDEIASFSNHGAEIDIAAPGVSIYSTYLDNQYRYKSGTSMAAPFVSGLAALLQTQYPDYTPDHVAAAMQETAVDLGDAGWDPIYGGGRIDVAAAIVSGAVIISESYRSPALHPTPVATQTTASAPATTPTASHIPGRLIIHLTDAAARKSLHAQQHAYQIESITPFITSTEFPDFTEEIARLEVPPGQEQQVAQQLIESGIATAVHFDYEVSLSTP